MMSDSTPGTERDDPTTDPDGTPVENPSGTADDGDTASGGTPEPPA
jgi:hypothetical protein